MWDIIKAILVAIVVMVVAIIVAYGTVYIWVFFTQKECIEGYFWSVRLGACIPGYIPK